MSVSERSAGGMSPSVRFLGFLKQQPDGAGAGADLELDERDVVWSSSTSDSWVSSTSATSSPSPTLSSPSAGSLRWPRGGLPSGSAGLSALLADEGSRAPTPAMPAAPRPEKLPRPQQYHQSAPVSVPPWSKRTADEKDDGGGSDADGDDEPVVPPHEMAARRAAAAASVMEGAGRTLKGRDLRRVRNAVWRTTGFLDL